MSAIQPLPGLSEVRAWSPDYLDRAAAQWIAGAVALDDAYGQVLHQVQAPGGTTWKGSAAEVAQDLVASDRRLARCAIDSLLGAASAARSGAGELAVLIQRILQAVEEAECGGFVVGEDYSVTARHVATLGSATSQAKADSFATAIRQQVSALAATDIHLASQITSAAVGLQTINPGWRTSTEQNRHPSIQLLDSGVIKDSPIPDPDIEPGSAGGGLSLPDARAIRDAIKDLPSGSRSNYLEVRDPEQLRQFGEWAKTGGQEYHSPNPYRGGGSMYRLPDGSIISQGPSVKHGLTMDISLPDGSHYRLHVDSKSGGSINMPRSTLIEPRTAPEPKLLPEPLPRSGIGVVGVPQVVVPAPAPGVSEIPVLDAGGGMFGAEQP
ncbi:hypothetical protein DVS77_28175 [Mycolicibacterium moriokaense]|nr:hypothetical protein DVS77_28175 [Mycolicibacterium moriokaense]